MNKWKIVVVSLLGVLFITPFTSIQAKEEKEAKQVKINAVALGNALNEQQKQFTMKALGAEGKGEIPVFTTTGEDLMKYLPNRGFTPDWSVYSSVRVETKEKGEGIDVKISTPENITAITPDQYKNAAVTAGVTDATITVASPIPIDGSGALAGVYVIIEKSGGVVNEDRVNLAQEELELTSQITKENTENDVKGFEADKLTKAINNSKATLAQYAADGDDITKEIIDHVFDQALEESGLENSLTPAQKDAIKKLLYKLKEADVYKRMATEIDFNKIKDQVMEKSKEAGNFLQRIWTSIKEFFIDVFDRQN